MGKQKSSNSAERKIIWDCFQRYNNIAKVVEILNFSRGKITNAITHYKKYETFENIPRQKPRKTTLNDDRRIANLSKTDPFLTSSQIRAQMETDYGVNVSSQTIRRRLQENNLHGRMARKKPLVSLKNTKKRLRFATDHLAKGLNFWNLIVWSDESKFNVFGNDGRPYVRRPPLKELDPKYTKKTVKHGGSSVMVWGCFTAFGVGPIVKIDGIMNGEMYKNILKENLATEYADNLPLAWIFQHDNDPKHCSKVVKSWLATQSIKLLEWPPQSPDLNPIENLWGIIKRVIAARKPTNKDMLWKVIQEEWHKITPGQCASLVASMPKRCSTVLKQKGYPTQY